MRVHSSYSHSPLEIKGCWIMQGPQDTGTKGGAPKFVERIFEEYPDIKEIAINKKDSGVIYSRMEE